MNNEIKNIFHITKRKNSAILIFSIFSSQLLSAVIIFNLSLITNYYLIWTVIYYIFSFIFAIPQSGISDVFGRKKHLNIASMSILLSQILLLIVFFFKSNLSEAESFTSSIVFVLPICLLLGMTGNAIPIARAGIADLKIHDFRTAMGWSTIMIGLGWISAVLLGILLPLIGLFFVCMILQIFNVIFIGNYFLDEQDSTVPVKEKRETFSSVAMLSYKWFGSMFLVIGGSAAILAYFFSETAFYQVFSLHEDGEKDLGIRIIGIFMAFGYTFGVIIQWIMSFSDKSGIKKGISVSMIALALLMFLNYFSQINPYQLKYLMVNSLYIEGLLAFTIALGYGFIDPSLFSLMSKKLEQHHFGKLFGAIDSTSTLGICFAFFILFLTGKFNVISDFKYLICLVIFLISCIFFIVFIKRFASYEQEKKD